MRVGSKQRVHGDRFVHAGLAAVAWLAACGHEARLGSQCPQTEPSCAGAGGAAVSAGGGGFEPTPPALDAAPSAPLDAGAEPPPNMPIADAQVPAPPDAATDAAAPTGVCRSVAMAFFACATGAEVAGTPHLRAGEAYTLRLRGDYALDTTFQVQGASAACFAVAFEPLTLAAGAAIVERCITPAEDVALLVTVSSGDPQVWSQGLMAEVCDGCE